MRKTKIFPSEFIKGGHNKERFVLRMLPNLNRFEKIGNHIVSTLVDNGRERPSEVFYSYAIISKEPYFCNNLPIGIVRYGQGLMNIIQEMLIRGISIFDLSNNYAILFEVSYEGAYRKYNHQIIEDNRFIIFNGGKSQEMIITRWLLDRNSSLERISLNTSSEKYKSKIFDKYKDIFRAEAIEDIGI